MKLIATHAIQARHILAKRSGTLKTTVAVREVAPAKVSLQQYLIRKGPPVRTPVLDVAAERVHAVPTGQPQPERLKKADGGFSTSVTPPFVNRIQAPYQRYAANLGSAELLALDALYEMGAQALSSSYARLTSKYEPGTGEASSNRDFSHMGEAQSRAYNQFHDLWGQIDEGLRRVAFDLVFEMTRPDKDRPLTTSEVGREVSRYQDERRAIGGAVTALRILAWRVLQIMKQERPKTKVVEDRPKKAS